MYIYIYIYTHTHIFGTLFFYPLLLFSVTAQILVVLLLDV